MAGNQTTREIGILHPGQMGTSIAAALAAGGHKVCWASKGRSAESIKRAEAAGLTDLGTLEEICRRCSIVFSICPPERAENLAHEVVSAGFSGIYADCNAIAAATSSRQAGRLTDAGASYVDGGIVGPPAVSSGSTRLYLAGPDAAQVATLFDGSVVDARDIGQRIGAASALKMAYAGWTKGSAALLMTMYAMAEQEEVAEHLLQEWDLSIPGLAAKCSGAAQGNSPKAWRFVGEMNEIATSLGSAGLPPEWFEAAAEVYSRLSEFKNRDDIELQQAVAALVKKDA